jgi:hypothetical protein
MPQGLLKFDNTLLTPPKWLVYTVMYGGRWTESIKLLPEDENFCNEHFEFFHNDGNGVEVEYEVHMNNITENYVTTNVRYLLHKHSVNHPNYYGGESNPYEVIKVCEAWELDKDAYLFNVVKYVARAGKKNPTKEIEDLEKAVFYLNRKIQNLKNEKLQNI